MRLRVQVIASLPVKKNKNGTWSGINITYYGLLIACAQAFAMSVFCALMGSIRAPLDDLAMLAAGVLFVCVVASKALARMVEKKQHTFTSDFAIISNSCWKIIFAYKKKEGLYATNPN